MTHSATSPNSCFALNAQHEVPLGVYECVDPVFFCCIIFKLNPIFLMISDNIFKIKERITLACLRAKCDPNSVTIVAVSKGRSSENIQKVIESGIADIGENKVQEALLKYNELSAKRYTLSAIKWHMVGHLQTNKVKEAVRVFDLIQSVDSLHLAVEIDKQAARINKLQDILIQVNTSGEKSKFGLKPDGAMKAIGGINKLKNINIKGLMAIAPVVNNADDTRLYFRKLRELLEEINATTGITHNALQILSMGMTDDFELAIEEGSNMIRIGRAIFEYSV